MMAFTIQPFGLWVALAAALTLLLAGWFFRRNGIKAGTLSWVAVLGIPLAFVGARVAFCLAALDQVSEEGLSFVTDFSRGGYMLYGAVGGVLLALLLTKKITGTPFAKMADAIAVPGLLLIAAGRLVIGLVNGLDYGWGIEDWFMEDSGMSLFVWEDPSILYRLPFSLPDYYGNANWAVFVFEALIALVLALIVYRAKICREGGRILMALIGYAGTQALCESMRQDAVLRWGFVRINQILGGVIILGLVILCWALENPRSAKKLALKIAGLVVCALLVIAMEFALEKKISAIEWMPMDVCYLLMALGCTGMIAIAWPRAWLAKKQKKA